MKKIILILSIIIAIICIVIYFRYKEEQGYEKKGEILINKIEYFKSKNGYLPLTVSDLGLSEDMGEGPYYEIIDSLNYKVYFNIGFDNSKVYYSSSRQWFDEK